MKLFASAIATALLVSGVAHAETDLPNFSDRTTWTCDKEMIEPEMTELVAKSAAGTAFGLRLLYIKGDPVETSRRSNELRCKVVLVTNRSTLRGVFRFFNQDGHTLTGYQPNRSK
jgi:hypothetical protein